MHGGPVSLTRYGGGKTACCSIRQTGGVGVSALQKCCQPLRVQLPGNGQAPGSAAHRNGPVPKGGNAVPDRRPDQFGCSLFLPERAPAHDSCQKKKWRIYGKIRAEKVIDGFYFKCSSVYSESSIIRSRRSPVGRPGKLWRTSSLQNSRQIYRSLRDFCLPA